MSSPGEPPPQALSEPYVRLSPHTAPSVQPPKHPDDLASRPRLLLRRVGPVRAKAEPPTHLRSSSITEPSSLLRASLPPCPASVLWLSQVPSHLSFSLRIGTTGSHVPHRSLIQVHAAFMPGAEWALNRYAPPLSRRPHSPAVSTPVRSFRHVIGRFTFVRLHGSHLTQSSSRAFSSNAHHQGTVSPAACGGLRPAPASRPRGALPHLRQSTTPLAQSSFPCGSRVVFVTHNAA